MLMRLGTYQMGRSTIVEACDLSLEIVLDFKEMSSRLSDECNVNL